MTDTDRIRKGVSARKILDQGGDAFVNRCGSIYTVDVFSWDSDMTDDPVYHAAYGTWDEAMADFDSWKAWPTN